MSIGSTIFIFGLILFPLPVPFGLPTMILGLSIMFKASDQFSFPSGHTSTAFMVAAITRYFMPVLLLPLLMWAALVGFSRVVLGVHFPTDTLVRMVLGVSVAVYSLNQSII
jgi:undecaprenyl-diphosphatase